MIYQIADENGTLKHIILSVMDPNDEGIQLDSGVITLPNGTFRINPHGDLISVPSSGGGSSRGLSVSAITDSTSTTTGLMQVDGSILGDANVVVNQIAQQSYFANYDGCPVAYDATNVIAENETSLKLTNGHVQQPQHNIHQQHPQHHHQLIHNETDNDFIKPNQFDVYDNKNKRKKDNEFKYKQFNNNHGYDRPILDDFDGHLQSKQQPVAIPNPIQPSNVQSYQQQVPAEMQVENGDLSLMNGCGPMDHQNGSIMATVDPQMYGCPPCCCCCDYCDPTKTNAVGPILTASSSAPDVILSATPNPPTNLAHPNMSSAISCMSSRSSISSPNGASMMTGYAPPPAPLLLTMQSNNINLDKHGDHVMNSAGQPLHLQKAGSHQRHHSFNTNSKSNQSSISPAKLNRGSNYKQQKGHTTNLDARVQHAHSSYKSSPVTSGQSSGPPNHSQPYNRRSNSNTGVDSAAGQTVITSSNQHQITATSSPSCNDKHSRANSISQPHHVPTSSPLSSHSSAASSPTHPRLNSTSKIKNNQQTQVRLDRTPTSTANSDNSNVQRSNHISNSIKDPDNKLESCGNDNSCSNRNNGAKTQGTAAESTDSCKVTSKSANQNTNTRRKNLEGSKNLMNSKFSNPTNNRQNQTSSSNKPISPTRIRTVKGSPSPARVRNCQSDKKSETSAVADQETSESRFGEVDIRSTEAMLSQVDSSSTSDIDLFKSKQVSIQSDTREAKDTIYSNDECEGGLELSDRQKDVAAEQPDSAREHGGMIEKENCLRTGAESRPDIDLRSSLSTSILDQNSRTNNDKKASSSHPQEGTLVKSSSAALISISKQTNDSQNVQRPESATTESVQSRSIKSVGKLFSNDQARLSSQHIADVVQRNSEHLVKPIVTKSKHSQSHNGGQTTSSASGSAKTDSTSLSSSSSTSSSVLSRKVQKLSQYQQHNKLNRIKHTETILKNHESDKRSQSSSSGSGLSSSGISTASSFANISANSHRGNSASSHSGGNHGAGGAGTKAAGSNSRMAAHPPIKLSSLLRQSRVKLVSVLRKLVQSSLSTYSDTKFAGLLLVLFTTFALLLALIIHVYIVAPVTD